MNHSPSDPNNEVRMYVPLHVHSHYSILDGMAPVEKLIDKAVACGMPGIALTDHGAMYGIKNFTNYVNEKINSDKLSHIKQLRKQIKELQHETTVDDIISVLSGFGDWLIQRGKELSTDTAFVQELTRLQDIYVQECLQRDNLLDPNDQ